jgi:hypothetical protein
MEESRHPQHRDLKKQAKSQHCDDRLVISEQMLARWWRLVAFMKATNLFHQAMRAVLYCRIATAIEMASKGGGHVAHCCVDCVPSGCRGNTEQVAAHWQSLVAFMNATDLLHWAMRSVFHRRTAMAIKLARDGGAFIRRRRLFRLL